MKSYNEANHTDLKYKIKYDKIKLRCPQQKKGKKEWYKRDREIFNPPSGVINIGLGGKLESNSLIDTGNTVNLMRNDVYDELKVIRGIRLFSETQVKCVTVSNEPMSIDGQCEVSVKIDSKSWFVKFFGCKELNMESYSAGS